MPSIPSRVRRMALTALVAMLASVCLCADTGETLFELLQATASQKPAFAKQQANDTSRITGGLCVQLGSSDLGFVLEAARTGRFLVHVLDADPSAVARARQHLQEQSLYGLVSVDRASSARPLPYADNLVNVLVVEPNTGLTIPPAEIARVVSPNGLVIIPESSAGAIRAAGLQGIQSVDAGGRRLVARKPWPTDMDSWTHPRHASDGNAVSADTLVGPPRGVQWVAGPPREINYMVSSAGRNFYAGLLARDSFNGLRLWQKSLGNSTATYGAELGLARGKARPVAACELVFALHGGKLVAIDGATGETVREYPDAGVPADMLHTNGILLALDKQSVRALQSESGRLMWTCEATEPRYMVAGDDAVYLLQSRPRRGETVELTSLDLTTGSVRWGQTDYPWMPGVRRLVY
ncbi:MAG: PQQ-binding-like beta-propeller repeat protein, partial [Armatimonadota bacterium]